MFNHLRIVTLSLLIVLFTALLHAEQPFPYLWSGFSTSLKGRSVAQRANAMQAGRELDGVIIPPGGVFSFNERVGARERAKGYRAAPYLNADGLLDDTPGGGICQLSSTIYNAALLAGAEIVERHPHSRAVTHVPPGRDATISSWRKDLKFKNPFSHPLQIIVSSDNNRITVALRSAVEKDFTVEIISEQSALPPQTVAVPLNRKQEGREGFSTATWRVTRKGGREQKELLSEDVYPPASRIIAGGSR